VRDRSLTWNAPQSGRSNLLRGGSAPPFDYRKRKEPHTLGKTRSVDLIQLVRLEPVFVVEFPKGMPARIT